MKKPTGTLADIDAAIAAGSIRTFRAKYPGSCFCCGHKFRTPVEQVYQVARGQIACWDCYSTALTTTPA